MAVTSSTNPSVERVGLPGGVIITAGTAGYTAALIAGLIGTAVAIGSGAQNGSIYICTSATTPGVWVNVAGTWTQLTIN